MKQTIITIAMALYCLVGYSQKKGDDIQFPHITLENGTNVSSSYNNENKTLTILVSENNDELEVIVTDNTAVVEEEYTTSQQEQLDIDLSGCNHRQLDVFVRSRNELQYVGCLENKTSE